MTIRFAYSTRQLERALDRALASLENFRPDEKTKARLLAYLEHTTAWGQKIDLVAPRSLEEFVDLSVAGAAVIAEAHRQDPELRRIVDVGSGGGAPGIPLLIMLEQGLASQVVGTLVEPRAKRVAFLRHVVGVVGLDGVRVVRGRSQQLDGEDFDVALARATLPPQEWLNEGARLCRGCVWVLVAREAPPRLSGWHVDLNLHYKWPLTGVARQALRFVPDGSSIGVVR